MGVCGVYLGSREIGRATWQQTGSRLRLQADCPGAPGWIYRLVLQTDRGAHRLGVMLPENDRFVLTREIPAEALPQRALIDRTLPGEAHLPGLPLAFSAFSQAREEETLLAACASDESGLRSAVWDDTTYLLYPIRFGDICPMAPFFCLTEILSVQENTYGIFCRKAGQYLPLSDRLRPMDML